jgi:2'-5' RNA ligase
MLQTIADDLWGKPSLAYHVQPVLPAEALAALESLLRPIARRWPAPLHLASRSMLHVTIYALVPVKGDFDKEGYWGSIADPSLTLVEELCAGHGPIELHFSRLKVTDTAIVAVAQETSGLIEAIRERIATTVPPPPGREPLRYDLIHTTLARYRSSGPVPDAAMERVESLPVSIHARVRGIKLVRETLFPCQAVDEIAAVPLTGKRSDAQPSSFETLRSSKSGS